MPLPGTSASLTANAPEVYLSAHLVAQPVGDLLRELRIIRRLVDITFPTNQPTHRDHASTLAFYYAVRGSMTDALSPFRGIIPRSWPLVYGDSQVPTRLCGAPAAGSRRDG
jgi:hypothetical protein